MPRAAAAAHAVDAGDAVVDGDEEARLHLRGERDDLRRQAVAVLEAVGHDEVDVGAHRAQAAHADRAGGGAVGVVVGDDDDASRARAIACDEPLPRRRRCRATPSCGGSAAKRVVEFGRRTRCRARRRCAPARRACPRRRAPARPAGRRGGRSRRSCVVLSRLRRHEWSRRESRAQRAPPRRTRALPRGGDAVAVGEQRQRRELAALQRGERRGRASARSTAAHASRRRTRIEHDDAASPRSGSAAKLGGGCARRRCRARAPCRARRRRPRRLRRRSRVASRGGVAPSAPPPEIQMPVTGTRPRASRAALTGCSCSSICISSASAAIAPASLAGGQVADRSRRARRPAASSSDGRGVASVTNHASGRGAWNARPSPRSAR